MVKQGLAICWFRNDLRIQDNPALKYALDNHAQVLCLYLDNVFLDCQPGNDPSAADVWCYAAVQDLAEQLHGRLLYQAGDIQQNLFALVQQYDVAAVYWNRAYDPPNIERDKQIKAQLQADGIEVRSFANLLFEPWQVLKADGEPYRVFTPFYKACLAKSLALPEATTKLDKQQLYPGQFDASVLPHIKRPWAKQTTAHWRISRAGAEQQLQQFIQTGLTLYAKGRDLPAKQLVSGLAPYLHAGQLSPREVVAAVSGLSGADAFIRQLIWREFAHAVLYHWPDTLEQPLDKRFANFPWQDDPAALQAWQKGQTGVPMVDAGMRQLWQTGYMHNRVRMLVASYLCKHLLLNWRFGAAWFMYTLFDADLANNTMGWQWVAGCGVDAAPYFRIFNPVTQGEKFDAKGEYVRRWVPELQALPDKFIHKPWEIATQLDYPEPMVNLAEGRKRALEAWGQIK
jgi:deoxyribodipyrimidine photo-lyase